MAVPSRHCMVTTCGWALVSWQQVHCRCMAWASAEYLGHTAPSGPAPPPGHRSWLPWGLEVAAPGPSTWGFAILAWGGLWALTVALTLALSQPGTLSSHSQLRPHGPLLRTLPWPGAGSWPQPGLTWVGGLCQQLRPEILVHGRP